MKSIIASALLMLLASCNNTDKKEISMPGAYKMLSTIVKTGSSDSTLTNRQQLKIYTGNYMMYAGIESPDSVSLFGIGTYTINGDTLLERVIFSAYDSIKSTSSAAFKLVIEKTEKGYQQVIPDSSGSRTELYESVGTTSTSILDGPWRQTSAFIIKGNDTIMNINNQYKMYWAGQVIWGHNSIDSLKKIHTGIGIGTFEMKGEKKLTESMSASSNADVRNHVFDIDIEMNGKDQFKQTLILADGSKSVEIYQRLK